MQFPPPKKQSEQFAGEPYPVADERPSFVFPPPRSMDPSTPFEVAEQVAGKVVELQDGQLALNERVDHLDDVSGYAVAYQSESYMQKGSSEFYTVRFNSRLGPQKNATVNGDGTITLAKGTWHINCLVTTDTNTNNPTGFLRIDVLYPAGDPLITSANGGVYSSKEIQQQIQGGKWNSFPIFHPVVVDAPGFRVRARFRYAPSQLLKTLIRGGTELSHLAVDRKDLSSENAVVDENPPTGDDIN